MSKRRETNPTSLTELEDEQTCELMGQVKDYLYKERSEKVPKHSAEEYFLMLLKKGLEAREEGNYGIAAALVMSSNGVETIVFGKNSVFSDQDPLGHAEMNVIKNVKLIMDGSQEVADDLMMSGDLLIRETANQENKLFLVSTLEPCPMCTVGSVINADIGEVLIGTPDEVAGALAEERLSSLAPLWANTAERQELNVSFAQSDNPEDVATYVPVELQQMLNDLFFQTRGGLDEVLDQEGFINFDRLAAISQDLLD